MTVRDIRSEILEFQKFKLALCNQLLNLQPNTPEAAQKELILSLYAGLDKFTRHYKQTTS
jgi:hypothetical protein